MNCSFKFWNEKFSNICAQFSAAKIVFFFKFAAHKKKPNAKKAHH